MVERRRHDPDVQKWYFHMAKGGWEKFRYIDALRDYKNIIAELELLRADTCIRCVYAIT
jgi:pyruvate/oxaloacetate carboxyltransferase